MMASTSTERVRQHRERKKWLELQIAGKPTPLPKLPPPGQEWKAIYEWSKTLVVPSVARKNGKSALGG